MDALLEQGLNIMLYGMGMVFCFLTLLVFCITGSSKVLLKWFPDSEPVNHRRNRKNTSSAAISQKTLAILQAAIDQHRNSRT